MMTINSSPPPVPPTTSQPTQVSQQQTSAQAPVTYESVLQSMQPTPVSDSLKTQPEVDTSEAGVEEQSLSAGQTDMHGEGRR